MDLGIPNGSQAGWISTQSRTRDMADPGGFEPNVLAFSNPQVDVLNSVDYHNQPNTVNGLKAGWSLAQGSEEDEPEPKNSEKAAKAVKPFNDGYYHNPNWVRLGGTPGSIRKGHNVKGYSSLAQGV